MEGKRMKKLITLFHYFHILFRDTTLINYIKEKNETKM